MGQIPHFQKYLNAYFGAIRAVLPKIIPQKQAENAIGLDIASADCKMIEVKQADGKYELASWNIEPMGKDGLKPTIQRLLQKLPHSPKTLSTAMFGKGTLIRYIEMPKMSIDDLKNAFNIEADKYFPFAQDQIYTDCYILEVDERSKKMSVMAAAVKKELVDERVKLLTDLGIEVNFIGLNPVALSNVLNVIGHGQDIKPGSAVALLDMGDAVSNLSILINNLPRFTRDIFMGGRDFTKQIANTFNVDIKEAEKIKTDPQTRKQEILSACESVVMNIVQELRLSFDYFSTEKSVEISHLLITGGSSLLEGLDEALTKNLEVPVTRWNPLSSLQIPDNILKDSRFKAEPYKMGVALGLALYAYD